MICIISFPYDDFFFFFSFPIFALLRNFFILHDFLLRSEIVSD